MATPTITSGNYVSFNLDSRASHELDAICNVLGIDNSAAVSMALNFFWGGCKDSLKKFVEGVRTLPKDETKEE